MERKNYITSDVIRRANEAMMSGTFKNNQYSKITENGYSISVMYNGKLYTTEITKEDIKRSYQKALDKYYGTKL